MKLLRKHGCSKNSKNRNYSYTLERNSKRKKVCSKKQNGLWKYKSNKEINITNREIYEIIIVDTISYMKTHTLLNRLYKSNDK